MKSKILTFLALSLFFAGVFSSCKKPESEKREPDNPIEYPIQISYEEFSLEGTQCQWKNVPFNDKVVVINNNEELEKYLSCPEDTYPAIDFSKQTLLLASGKSNSGVLNLSVTDLQQHSFNKYSLDLEITLSDTAVRSSWFKALIINKTSGDTKVRLNTIINNQETIYPIEVPFLDYSLENSDCKWHEFLFGVCDSSDVIMINNREQLEYCFDCYSEGNYPMIDFSKHTLILAFGKIYQDFTLPDTKILQRSSTHEYVLKIHLTSSPSDEKGWAVPIIVNKMHKESYVKLLVSKN